MASDPQRLISAQSLLEVIGELAGIRAFDGYRTATTAGEQEAFAVIAARLEAMSHLTRRGLELEEQTVRTPFGLIPRVDRLWLTIGGVDHEVPASAPAGFSVDFEVVHRFDSDGVVGDGEPDPVEVTAPAALIATPLEMLAISSQEIAGSTLILRHEAVDWMGAHSSAESAARYAAARLAVQHQPAAIVLVTEFSDEAEASRGLNATWFSLERFDATEMPPRMAVRLEDLEPAGISSWEDLAGVEAVTLLWDADVVSPGSTGALTATIPGADRTRSVILGSHVDSVNTPGALDDASGVAALLEVARVIDRTRITPPVDVVLAFFGYEEMGAFGSSLFTSTHEDLLDRAVAMLQVDCLTSPAAGLPRVVGIEGTPPAVAGNDSLPWPEYLGSMAARRRVWPVVAAAPFGSDNVAFQGFDVPNAEMIAWDPTIEAYPIPEGQLHVPYDDLPLAAREIDLLTDMVTIALGAALDAGADNPMLRTTPRPDRRALLVASHTELPHLSPAGLTEFGMALATAGFDIDMVPYGVPLTAAALAGADLVMTMPVFDAPVPEAGEADYDETWLDSELEALETYVADGGLLLITHARGMLMGFNLPIGGVTNEDAEDDNLLAGRFGLRFEVDAEPFSFFMAEVVGVHPVVAGIDHAIGGYMTGVPVEHDGVTLLSIEGHPILAAVPFGAHGGEVLAVGDLGLFADNYLTDGQNLGLWLNLAAHARDPRPRRVD